VTLDDAVPLQRRQPLCEQSGGDAGAPCMISLKVRQPLRRFRTMIGVQRSASSSEARAIGQY
jgi:hypothetical protein